MPKKSDPFVDTSGWACYLMKDADEIHSIVAAFVQSMLKKRRHLVTTNYVMLQLITTSPKLDLSKFPNQYVNSDKVNQT